MKTCLQFAWSFVDLLEADTRIPRDQRLLGGRDGWQGWMEKEPWGVDWGRPDSSSNSSISRCSYVFQDRLIGLVVKASARGRKILGSNLTCTGIFLGSSHTSELKIGTPVATLPGTWHYRVSARTGWPGVSVLWLGEMDSLICNFCLSVAARKIVWVDPSLKYTRILLGS